GAFQLADTTDVNTVRVYGRLHGEAALLGTLHREGRPVVHRAASAPGEAPQFVAAWEGAPSGRGTRALRLELARQVGDGVRVVWSTAELFPDGLLARSYSVRPKEIRVRYELRYPGWTPGCEARTEAEDLYRLVPDTGVFARTSRTYHQPWHRELHATVWRLFEALGGGDQATPAGDAPGRARVRRAGGRSDPAHGVGRGVGGARTLGARVPADGARLAPHPRDAGAAMSQPEAPIPDRYEPSDVEKRWYPLWEEHGYFRGDPAKPGKPFSIVMPPPNVTGSLHWGHALDMTLQDVLVR